MAHGGRRPGAGRKKGARNKATRDLKDMIDVVSEQVRENDLDGMEQTLVGLFELARGVRVQEADGRVYRAKPDVPAIKVLLEMRFGKPKESVEITDPEAQLQGVPEILFPPPPWLKPEKPK